MQSTKLLKVTDAINQIVESYGCNQPNLNSTIKKAAEVAKELNQSNEKSDTKTGGSQHIKARLGASLENGKQSNACPVY
jgi:hypothetical protein